VDNGTWLHAKVGCAPNKPPLPSAASGRRTRFRLDSPIRRKMAGGKSPWNRRLDPTRVTIARSARVARMFLL